MKCDCYNFNDGYNCRRCYRDEVKSFMKEIEQLKKENNELKEALKNPSDFTNILIRDKKILIERSAAYQFEIRELKKENEELKFQNDAFGRNLNVLKQLCDNKEKENEDLKLKNEELDNFGILLMKGTSWYSEKTSEIKELKQEIKRLTSIAMTPECAALHLKNLSIE